MHGMQPPPQPPPQPQPPLQQSQQVAHTTCSCWRGDFVPQTPPPSSSMPLLAGSAIPTHSHGHAAEPQNAAVVSAVSANCAMPSLFDTAPSSPTLLLEADSKASPGCVGKACAQAGGKPGGPSVPFSSLPTQRPIAQLVARPPLSTQSLASAPPPGCSSSAPFFFDAPHDLLWPPSSCYQTLASGIVAAAPAPTYVSPPPPTSLPPSPPAMPFENPCAAGGPTACGRAAAARRAAAERKSAWLSILPSGSLDVPERKSARRSALGSPMPSRWFAALCTMLVVSLLVFAGASAASSPPLSPASVELAGAARFDAAGRSPPRHGLWQS